jgi:hypothetical protein
MAVLVCRRTELAWTHRMHFSRTVKRRKEKVIKERKAQRVVKVAAGKEAKE